MHLPTLNVFVSSTWLDLRPERATILDVAQRIKQLRFVGMEYFGSRDETTHQASIDEVDRSDLYIGIVAGRYGSGITEQEYLRARERGIPCFIYLKSEQVIKNESEDRSSENRQQLIEFKRRLHQHHACSEFFTPDELAFKLTTDLHNWLFEKHLNCGLANLSTDYASRVQGFVTEYVGGADRHVPFGGRNLETETLNEWLADPAGPQYFLIAAGAGRGKSALLVHWTRELLARDDVAVLFFPISIRFRTNLESVVFASLATYLATVHGEQLSLPPDTPSEVYRSQVADYITRPLTDGRQLLLVLDGLDEAAEWDVGPDLFPPQSSRSARVVVSARFLAGDVNAGDWLRRLGWDKTGLAQSMELPPLTESGVADVLENMGFPLRELGSHTDIVNALHRLSEGDPLLVRLYVDDLWNRGEEAARLQVDDLHMIRPGLEGFFARWWDDQRKLWGSASHPLREKRVQTILNYLAGALGPLSRDDLLDVADPEVDLTTWTLEEALEPLRRFIAGDGVQQGYVYSHPRLGIYFLERLSTAERKRIDQNILDWCAKSVQENNIKDARTEKISPYIVQYFGVHLERSQAGLDLFELLLSDSWRKAWHVFEGTYAGFRADVRRVWRAAERIHITEAGAGIKPNRLALEVRCALCIASVDQLSENTPPELIGALLEKSLWPSTAALGYARLIQNPKRRAQALLCLVNSIADQVKNKILQETLEAISMVDEGADQVSMLQTIAPLLTTSIMSQAMAITLEISQKAYMVEALLCLAPHFSSTHVEQAVQAARKLQDDDLRSEFLRTIATFHPELLLKKLQDSLREADAWERTWIMLGASDGLSGEARHKVLLEALGSINTIDIHSGRFDLMFMVIDRLEPARQKTLADELFSEISNLPHSLQKAKSLSKLVMFIEVNKRKDVVQQTLFAIENITSESWRAECLAWLAPALDVTQQDIVFSLAMDFSDESMQAKTLAGLIPHLHETLQKRAILALCEIDDPFERALGAVQVADFLDEVKLKHIMGALIVEELGSTWRYSLLREFAPHLSPLQLDDLAANIPHIFSDLEEMAVYSALAPYSSRALDRFIHFLTFSKSGGWGWDVDEAFKYLNEVVQCVDERTRMRIAESIFYWPDEVTKLRFLQCVAAHLSTPLLERFTDFIFSWENKGQKLEAVRIIAAHLPASLLMRTLQEVQVIGDDVARQQLLFSGSKLLPIQYVVKAHVWTLLSTIDQVWLMIDWFVANNLQPTDGELTETVHLIASVQDDAKRAEAISGLINHYGKSLASQDINATLRIILSMPPEYYTTNALAKIIPFLSDNQINENFLTLFDALLDPSPDGITLATNMASRVPETLFMTTFREFYVTESTGADNPREGILEQRANRRLASLAAVIEQLPNSHRDAAKNHLVNVLRDMLQIQGLERFETLVHTEESAHALLEMYISLAGKAVDDSHRLQTVLMFIKNMKKPVAIEVVSDLVDLSLSIPEDNRLIDSTSSIPEDNRLLDSTSPIPADKQPVDPTSPLELVPKAVVGAGLWDSAVHIHCLPKLQKESWPLSIQYILETTKEHSKTELGIDVLEYLLPYATGNAYQTLATELLLSARNAANLTSSVERLTNLIPNLQAAPLDQACGDAIVLIQKSRAVITGSTWQDQQLEYCVSNLLTMLLPRVAVGRAQQLWVPLSRISTENILMAFIQHMPNQALVDASDVILQLIRLMESSTFISNALCTLGRRLGSETTEKYIKTVEALKDPTFRAITFTHAMPYIPKALLQNTGTKALAAASEISDVSERVAVLQGMIRIFKWPQLIQLALETFVSLGRHSTIVRACVNTLPDLEEPHRSHCARMALNAAKQIEDEHERAGLLQDLGSLLPEEVFETAIELLTQISDTAIASRAGVSLLQYSPPSYVPKLLRVITRNYCWIEDERAPRIITESITDPELAKEFFETLECARSEIKKSSQYSFALRVLTPYFSWLCANAKTPSRSYYPLWHEFLVFAAGNKRAQLIDTVRELLPATKVLGGLESVEDISKSVTEVTTWWP